MQRFFMLILFLSIIYSCQEKLNKDIKVKYSYIKKGENPPASTSDRRDGTVVLLFTAIFNKDTVNIKYGPIDTTIHIATNEVVGQVEPMILGKINKGDRVKLKFNRYNPIDIKADEINQLFVIQYMDTTLTISSVYALFGGY